MEEYARTDSREARQARVFLLLKRTSSHSTTKGNEGEARTTREGKTPQKAAVSIPSIIIVIFLILIRSSGSPNGSFSDDEDDRAHEVPKPHEYDRHRGSGMTRHQARTLTVRNHNRKHSRSSLDREAPTATNWEHGTEARQDRGTERTESGDAREGARDHNGKSRGEMKGGQRNTGSSGRTGEGGKTQPNPCGSR